MCNTFLFIQFFFHLQKLQQFKKLCTIYNKIIRLVRGLFPGELGLTRKTTQENIFSLVLCNALAKSHFKTSLSMEKLFLPFGEKKLTKSFSAVLRNFPQHLIFSIRPI